MVRQQEMATQKEMPLLTQRERRVRVLVYGGDGVRAE